MLFRALEYREITKFCLKIIGISPIFLPSLLILSCSTGFMSENDAEWAYYGDSIDINNAFDIKELPERMKGKSMGEFKVKGSIQECCQKKGCWIKLDLGNGEQIRVNFKDYEFFVPLESNGAQVVMMGIASYDTTSVEALRHYAIDAGKSNDEVLSINDPKLELVFEASGLRLKK